MQFSTRLVPRAFYYPVLVACISAALLLTLPGLTAPAEAAAVRGAGFVWANRPTSSFYTPISTYQYNSSDRLSNTLNTISRSGVGSYTVNFPNLGVTGGTVHVTAYGTSSHRCKVRSWGPGDTTTQRVNVRCATISGTPVDTMFTASYTNIKSVEAGRKLGYVLANNPTASSYTPITTHQSNSTGALNTITRSAIGTYTVRMPGLGIAAGHVQVTAFGDTTDFCKVTGWGPSGSTQTIGVKCFTATGSPRDSLFTLTYVDRINILGLHVCCQPDGHHSAYAWAHNPTATSYTPFSSYQFASSNTTGTVTRSGVGAYNVKWEFMNLNNGNVQVTAYNTTSASCKVAAWNSSSGVQVRCFTASGVPIDTLFDVAFTGPDVVLG